MLAVSKVWKHYIAKLSFKGAVSQVIAEKDTSKHSLKSVCFEQQNQKVR